MAKRRLDQVLVDRGLAPSRAAAQAMLLAGEVELEGGQRALKPGQAVDEAVVLHVRQRPRFASRGGQKLAAALDAFEVDVSDLACLDAGASTGGFTDALLQGGARVVYAVDVGRGQLAERLRGDPRVVVMERTNLRTLESLPEPVLLATLDLSFISLRLVLPAVGRLLARDGRVVALVKPQFEAGRGAVPRGGVIRDAQVHRQVLRDFGDAALETGFVPRRVIRSPIEGGGGNVEFLALLERPAERENGVRDAWRTAVDALLGAPEP